MTLLQDSMVLLTSQEYKDLRFQQAHYFAVNREVNEIKQDYFYTGYHLGSIFGFIFGFCCIIIPIWMHNMILKIKRFKTKEND